MNTHTHTDLEREVYRLRQRVGELECKVEQMQSTIIATLRATTVEESVKVKSVTAGKGGVAIGGDCKGSIVTGG